MARSTDHYLCFDLGGTKLRAALINSAGKVLAQESKLIDQSLGLKGLLKDFKELAAKLPKHKYKSVSVASAGPLHAGRGVLLDPTNFFT
ncbi:MAG: ROK family protein, partial [Bdellovibrionales bacterium]